MLRRSDPDYEPARQAAIWNSRTPARYPDAIVKVATDQEVPAVLRDARAQGMKVTPRSGGHQFAGCALRDGGLLLDLSALDQISIDPAKRTASVGPGVTSRQLARALSDHGLAFPVGHCPTVALGGYLLSGGLGWNSGQWGPACLSVYAVEVVTASGEAVLAAEANHPELLWAARGAGPGFPGVVTCFHLRVQPLPQAISTRHVTFDLSELPGVAQWVEDLAPQLPDNVELATRIAPNTPRASDGMAVIVSATAFADTDDEAARALAPLGGGTESPLPALHDWLGSYFPDDHRYAAEAIWSESDPGSLLTALGAGFADPPSPLSLAVMVFASPDRDEEPPETAFSMTAPAFAAAYAIWDDDRADASNQEWHSALVAKLGPLTSGFYVGETDLFVPGHAERSFSPPAWKQLLGIREAWDPEELFQGFPGSSTDDG